MATQTRQDGVRAALDQVSDPMALLVGLVAHTPMGVQIFRVDGRCLVTNEAFREIFGAVPPPEYDIFTDQVALRAVGRRTIERAFAGETVHVPPTWYDAREQPVRERPGRRCAVTCTAFPLYDPAGRVAHVALVYEDVTDEILAREQAEAERARERETSRRLQALVDHAPALIFIRDLDGRHLVASAAAERAFGLAPGAPLGKTAREVLGDEMDRVTREADRRALAERRPVQSVQAMTTVSGPRQFLVTRFPILDAHGAPEAVGGIALDITERREAEEQLRRSEARFAQLFRALPMAALLSRLSDRRFVDLNDAWARLTGYAREELLGRTSVELGLWADIDRREQLFAELETRGVVQDFAARLRQKSGALRDVLLSVDRLELFGEPCLLLLAHDVTELRRLERALRQSQKMEAIGRLAGGLAHDFNNIMTAIAGADTLLLDGLPPHDPRRAYAEQIKRSTTRAATLTRQLLTFTRKQPEQPVALDPNEAVRAVVDMLQRMIGADITVRCELAAKSGVRADPGALEQVILNLAVNARDAMPGGGTLSLRTADVAGGDGVPAGDWVLVEVADTGLGMDGTTRARLFEPFFTTKEQARGTGLGLAVVYAIVTQSRGHITVDSEPGRGAAFRIYLPRERAPAAAETPAGPAPLPGGSETVLLVEDDEAVRDFLSFVLRQLGYRVLEAGDGAAALRLVEDAREPIDLLLSDIVMPHLDGIELAHQLMAQRPAMKVLLMSGYPGDAAETASVPGGRANLLSKPFERDDLARRVRSVLDGG